MVICLERGADLHMAQLMPLPLTVSCFSKIQIGFIFLVPAHLGNPGKRAVKWVCVCVYGRHTYACPFSLFLIVGLVRNRYTADVGYRYDNEHFARLLDKNRRDPITPAGSWDYKFLNPESRDWEKRPGITIPMLNMQSVATH